MTTYEKTGPRFKEGDFIRTWDDNDYKSGYTEGKVTGVSDEGITVQWHDLDEETDYDYDKVTIVNDLLIESGCPWPPDVKRPEL